MNHCRNLHIFNSHLNPITEIIIPPNQVSRIAPYVMQLMFQYGGKSLENGIGMDGSIRIEAYLPDDAKRQEFCERINKAIYAGQPISVTSSTDENGEEKLDIRTSIVPHQNNSENTEQ